MNTPTRLRDVWYNNSEAEGAINTFGPLTKSPVSEVIMAKQSLPKLFLSTKRSYDNAKSRCRNPAIAHFDRYGGRGIEFRFKSLDHFITTVGIKPSLDHSIDRYPDNNGHYEPGNVRWATRSEQARNRRSSRVITYNGVTQPLTAWADVLGLKPITLSARLRCGWCESCTVSVSKIAPRSGPKSSVCSHRRFRRRK